MKSQNLQNPIKPILRLGKPANRLASSGKTVVVPLNQKESFATF
jgi:hypothetical protein